MKTILFFSSDKRPSSAAKISGAYRYAKAVGWQIQVLDVKNSITDYAGIINFWHADGCIVECGSVCIPPKRDVFGKTPVVYLDADPQHADKKTSIVTHDSEADGRIAAKELLTSKCESFAFIAYPGDLFWSRDREIAFIKYLKLNGKSCIRVHPKYAREDEISLSSELREAIVRLPPNCGIFAANDFLAAKTLFICDDLNRRVPEDITIIGVDNNETLCENSSPTLTSIAPDFELGGYLAAELLDETIRHPRRRPEKKNFGPVAVIRRASTAQYSAHNVYIVRALDAIRSSSGAISVKEVLDKISCSRRLAELRFKEATGKSILKYTLNMRLENAFTLLKQKHIPLAQIPERVGYQSLAAFDRFFHAKTGVSPRKWRETSRTEQF